MIPLVNMDDFSSDLSSGHSHSLGQLEGWLEASWENRPQLDSLALFLMVSPSSRLAWAYIATACSKRTKGSGKTP